MQHLVIQFMRSPIVLMCASILLWMLYPPVVNYLIDRSSPIFVAATSHTLAAISTLVVVMVMFAKRQQAFFSGIAAHFKTPALLVPTLFSGALICANHLLLYAALNMSQEFDVIAILIFEAWPIVFFYIDSTLRKKYRTTTANDYIFSAAAFAGFIVLMSPNLDIADWLLLESPMINTILLAASGGLAMAINCYMRMKCMDAWSAISDKNALNLSSLNKALLTESGVRCVAAPGMLAILFLFGDTANQFDYMDYALVAFAGIAILALGSLLYDLSVFSATNASVSVFWYFMPVGAVVILALLQGRLLNQYEAVASVLIVSANIFLGLRFPLRSSLLILFSTVCMVGIWVLFAPTYPIDSYYDLLAVSTVFFVLLGTFALERTTSLNRERERLLVEFNDSVMQLPSSAPSGGVSAEKYKALINNYIVKHLYVFLRAFNGAKDMRNAQLEIQDIKKVLIAGTENTPLYRERLLDNFQVGQKLMTMESDRIPPEELVILILLGATNVFFSLIFRPESFSTALFALILATSVIFLILVINERNQYIQIRHDHALVCRDLLEYADEFKQKSGAQDVDGQHEAVERSLSLKTVGPETVSHSYWIFSIFVFLFCGFGYGFLYETLDDVKRDESAPILSKRDLNNAELNIALLDWPTAQIKAHILATIINEHTESRAQLVNVTHEQAFKQMGQHDGDIDVHPDIWLANNADLIRRYVRAFETVKLGESAGTGKQGLCYTDFTAPATLAVNDLVTPENASRFDMSGNGRGDIWVGAKGWASVAIEKRRLNAYGLDAYYDYHVFDLDLLDQLINRNNQNEQPGLFFCYYPDALFGNRHVHFVEEPAHDAAIWQAIFKAQGLNKLSTGTSWPQSEIKLGFRSQLETRSPELLKLLNRFVIDDAELVAMLSAVENGEDIETVSQQWADNHKDLILEWLTGFTLRDNTE